MAVKTFRTDSASEQALEYLVRELGGAPESEAMRVALVEAADARRRAALRAEALEISDDPDDRAAAQDLAAEMADIRAW